MRAVDAYPRRVVRSASTGGATSGKAMPADRGRRLNQKRNDSWWVWVKIRKALCNRTPGLEAAQCGSQPDNGERASCGVLLLVPVPIGSCELGGDVAAPAGLAAISLWDIEAVARVLATALHRAVTLRAAAAEHSIHRRHGHRGDDEPAKGLESKGYSFRPHSYFVAQVSDLVNKVGGARAVGARLRREIWRRGWDSKTARSS